MLKIRIRTFNKKECINMIYSYVFMLSILLFVYIHNTLYKFVVVIIGGISILKAVYCSKKLSINGMMIYWILFCGWSFLSSLWEYYQVPVDKLIVLWLIIYNYLFLCNYVITESKFYCMLKAYMFSAAVLEIYLFFYYGISSIIASRRLPSEIVNSNAVGSILASAMILALFFWKKDKGKRYFFVWIILGLGVLVSGSRSAFLNAVLSGSVFFVICYRKQISFKHIIGLFVAVGIVGILVLKVDFFYDIIGRRLESLWNVLLGKSSIQAGGKYESTYIRSYVYRESWVTFLRHPIGGVGLDNFRYINSYGMYAHSNILELLATLGLIGTIFFYGAYIEYIGKYEKLKKYMRDEERALILGLAAGFIVVNLFGVVYNNLNEHILLFLVYCNMNLQSSGRGYLVEMDGR